MAFQKTVQFSGRFTQAGDELKIDHQLGRHMLTLRAAVSVDDFQHLDDDPAIDDDRRASFSRGEWQYLEVAVSLEIDGEEVDCQTLSGIDVGDDARYLLCVANHLIGALPLPLRTLSFEEAFAPLDR
jgi:hypothetical protein